MPPNYRNRLRLPVLFALALCDPAMAAEHVSVEDLARRLQVLEQRLAITSATNQGQTDLAELDQRLKVLERKLELQGEEAATKAATQPTVSLSASKGLSIKSPDADGIEVKFKGLVQADGRVFFGDSQNPQNDTFLLRRVEPTLEGTWGPLVGFRIQAQLAGDTATLNDAYVELKFDPRATVRAGKFKVPFGLEQLEPSGSLPAVERGLPSELTPGRDYGVQLQGAFLRDTLNYAIEAANGVPDGRDGPAGNPDNSLEYAARVFWEPFKNDATALSGLGFGFAASVGDKSGNGDNVLPRYRTPGQVKFFNYRADALTGGSDVFADGQHRRWSPQGYFYHGRLGLLAEYVASEQELRLAGGANDGVRRRIRNDAYGATASFVVTGEDASYRGVAQPNHPFTVGSPGWGALELVARYGKLSIDPNAFPLFANPGKSAQTATSWVVGVNWYLTRNLKLVANYSDTLFNGGAANGLDREDEKAFFTRAQFSF
ncbi:MAG: phosphate-selective porin [Xanthomonadaceae bacterium]|nr:phosphate-selective porin [Xanthomonadaceae bacterium]